MNLGSKNPHKPNTKKHLCKKKIANYFDPFFYYHAQIKSNLQPGKDGKKTVY